MPFAPRLAALPLLLLPLAAPAGEVAATARSQGFETRCAEMDNVLVALGGEAVRAFAITATPPAYLTPGMEDVSAADFTGCVFPEEPIWRYEDTYSATIWEDERLILEGHRLAANWREEEVDVTAAGRVHPGIHLLQLAVKGEGRPVQILVLYPTDGHWRAKPLPPADRADTVFGSSFLIGPVEVDRRPLVRYTDVEFVPERLAFRFGFALGGGGELRVVSARPGELRLDVSFEGAVEGRPFALLSSMHVEPGNADVGRVLVRPAGRALWDRIPIDGLSEATAAEFAFGRDAVSRHNTSAPDLTFGPFRDQP